MCNLAVIQSEIGPFYKNEHKCGISGTLFDLDIDFEWSEYKILYWRTGGIPGVRQTSHSHFSTLKQKKMGIGWKQIKYFFSTPTVFVIQWQSSILIVLVLRLSEIGKLLNQIE